MESCKLMNFDFCPFLPVVCSLVCHCAQTHLGVKGDTVQVNIGTERVGCQEGTDSINLCVFSHVFSAALVSFMVLWINDTGNMWGEKELQHPRHKGQRKPILPNANHCIVRYHITNHHITSDRISLNQIKLCHDGSYHTIITGFRTLIQAKTITYPHYTSPRVCRHLFVKYTYPFCLNLSLYRIYIHSCTIQMKKNHLNTNKQSFQVTICATTQLL